MYDKLNKFEKIVFDVLAVILVLFYSYSAVVQPAATQYHRGVYVLVTYVLVFLLYPVGKSWVRYPLLIFVGAIVRVSGAALLERSLLVRRPGYADYVRRTSGFVPLPPRIDDVAAGKR